MNKGCYGWAESHYANPISAIALRTSKRADHAYEGRPDEEPSKGEAFFSSRPSNVYKASGTLRIFHFLSFNLDFSRFPSFLNCISFRLPFFLSFTYFLLSSSSSSFFLSSSQTITNCFYYLDLLRVNLFFSTFF